MNEIRVKILAEVLETMQAVNFKLNQTSTEGAAALVNAEANLLNCLASWEGAEKKESPPEEGEGISAGEIDRLSQSFYSVISDKLEKTE